MLGKSPSFWSLHWAWRAGRARGSARQDEILWFDQSVMKNWFFVVNQCFTYRNIIFFFLNYTFFKGIVFLRKSEFRKKEGCFECGGSFWKIQCFHFSEVYKKKLKVKNPTHFFLRASRWVCTFIWIDVKVFCVEVRAVVAGQSCTWLFFLVYIMCI